MKEKMYRLYELLDELKKLIESEELDCSVFYNIGSKEFEIHTFVSQEKFKEMASAYKSKIKTYEDRNDLVVEEFKAENIRFFRMKGKDDAEVSAEQKSV